MRVAGKAGQTRRYGCRLQYQELRNPKATNEAFILSPVPQLSKLQFVAMILVIGPSRGLRRASVLGYSSSVKLQRGPSNIPISGSVLQRIWSDPRVFGVASASTYQGKQS